MKNRRGVAGGIAGLADQQTARLGNTLGQSGVALGMGVTLGAMHPDPGTALQVAGLLGAGGGAGYMIANRVGPTELPQLVAAFHSLVGIAAAATAVGEYPRPRRNLLRNSISAVAASSD